jgi:glyoxylase-like metal-dependent hydrolase (beta-lactamase superfamily II)
MRLGKTLKITALAVLLGAFGAIATVVGILMFGGPSMESGSTLVGGKVTLVVDRMGPVRIGAYIVELAEGGFALVDAGMDPEAKAVLAALNKRGAHAGDVRAVFVTHAHDDHFGGAHRCYVGKPRRASHYHDGPYRGASNSGLDDTRVYVGVDIYRH